jgi:head-tail adaptor
MSLLTDSEVAAMRSTLDQSMPSTASILRRTSAVDNLGGQTWTWNAVATNVPVRLSPSPSNRTSLGAERQTAERDTGKVRWVMTFTHDTDITLTDRVTIGARKFEVAGVDARMSWELDTRVNAIEVL